MPEDLVSQSIELPSGELRLLQPQESAELPDADAVEWAPIAPYWSVLWRSGVALARELDGMALRDLRVVELGCGLAAPSIALNRRLTGARRSSGAQACRPHLAQPSWKMLHGPARLSTLTSPTRL